jgi:hypothetical protein
MHAFNKNMWHATLIAGDLDFKPLVDALVNVGVHVHVFYEPRSASKRLYRSADVAVPMTLDDFWNWSTRSYQRGHPKPTRSSNGTEAGEFLMKRGTWKGRAVRMWEVRTTGDYIIYVTPTLDEYSLEIRFGDSQRLEQYFELMHGELAWEAPAGG